MADNYLITGYWGEPHVTTENDRGINAAMFGTGRFVLPVGEEFAAELIGGNTVRMYDGKLMDNGAAAGIPVGEYVDLLIANAGQGMKRNDLIVFQYEQDSSTLIESGSFVVVQGDETTGTAVDPVLIQKDLLSGKADFDQMALWRVSVSGATISAPVKVFELWERKAEMTAEEIGAVKKSGDTMTGNLLIKKNRPALYLGNTENGDSATYGTASNCARITLQEVDGVASNGRMLYFYNAAQNDIANALRLIDVKNSTQTGYTILHTGNFADYAVPLDGSKALTGALLVDGGFGRFGASNTSAGLSHRPAIGDSTNMSWLGVSHINDLKEAVQFLRRTAGKDIYYNVFHTGNKPSGSYTGNGSAASRTINIGGIGNAVLITGSAYTALVGPYGAFVLDLGGTVTGLNSSVVTFVNGVLTIVSQHPALNVNGTTYNYQVL